MNKNVVHHFYTFVREHLKKTLSCSCVADKNVSILYKIFSVCGKRLCVCVCTHKHVESIFTLETYILCVCYLMR